MHIKIKILNENVRKFYEERKNHPTDSGFDIYMPEDIRFTATKGCAQLIGLGIAVEAFNADPKNYFAKNVAFRIVPRSSICKTPLRLANSEGIIDQDYRGELKAAFDCLTLSHNVKQGQRLLQIVAPDLGPITFEIVDELSDTERGTGGIGSTGK